MEKEIVQSWCTYEEVENQKPPCIAECHGDCKYMLLMYEDGYSMFGNEEPKDGYERP